MSKRTFLKKITALSLCLCSVIAVSACDSLGNILPFMKNSSIESSMSNVTLSVTQFDQPVSLVHQSVSDYLSADPEELVTAYLPGGTMRVDKGRPVTFEYSARAEDGALDISYILIECSLDQDFAVIEHTQKFSPRQKELEVYNLKTGAHYYYRFTLHMTDGDTVSTTGEFDTAASPRMINLDGACNVRDIGGWKTEDGKTIKQGLLFRGSEIDGGKNKGHADFCLTSKGVEQLRALGIKTDLDLRDESTKVSEYSILGEDVSRSFYNAAQYQSILDGSNAERTRKIFSPLAKPEAYPVYLHCTHGVDRAGSTTLILEALLGMSKEDLIRDYELSAFYYNYAHVNRNTNTGGTILDLIDGLEEGYAGETFADKVEKFLLSIGVTQAEIDSIRNIFLG